MGKLDGKVAIITASTIGIGFAMTEMFAKEGASVVISSRSRSNVDTALGKLKTLGFSNVHGVVCHVSKREERQKLIEITLKKFGKIDILVSNAGINPIFHLSTLKCPEASWDKIFDVNVKSMFLLTKEVAPHLKDGGRIIYLTSIAAYTPQGYSMGVYSVTKTALLALTKVFAEEFAPKTVTVNCIAPGLIDTDFAQAIVKKNGWENYSLFNKILLRRPGKPSEVAAVALFLCSDECSYVTGETIVVAGGLPSRL